MRQIMQKLRLRVNEEKTPISRWLAPPSRRVRIVTRKCGFKTCMDSAVKAPYVAG
jgi:hypothetical protein